MRANVFFKTYIRQSWRSLLLALLVGVAAFAFVARAVEYIVVRDEIARIEGFYRSIGFLQHPDWIPATMGEAVEIIAQSPYLHFYETGPAVQGVLPEGMLNADYFMSGTIAFFDSYGVQHTYDHRGTTYFYATVTRLGADIRVDVENVITGHPQVIRNGSNMPIVPPEDAPEMSLEIGQMYFFRALSTLEGTFMRPNGRQPMYIQPLNYTRAAVDGPIWYLPAAQTAGMAWLADEVELLNINHRGLSLTGAQDVSAMPRFQAAANDHLLVEGRLPDLQDHLEANPVIAIHADLAIEHGLELGDSLALTLRNTLNTRFHGILHHLQQPDWQELSTEVVEFTLVGFFRESARWGPVGTIYRSMAYIPQSVLPEGFGDNTMLYLGNYSFVLDSPRNEAAFMAEVREPLQALGFNIVIFPTTAQNFFDAADPILQSAAINVVIFAVVSVMIIALAVFIYLRQNKRNIAIYRALGGPVKTTAAKNLFVLTVFWLPIIVLGALAGRFFALFQANRNLSPALMDYTTEIASMPLTWLAIIGGGFVLLVLLATVAGIWQTARRPVLEMLQEGKARK
ncbi:MAG: ABC transporter permease [Clostridiales bacterium]|jgi:hypothetical protein|nr:ABC transporter permease [Clostridiales bacterium]